MDSRYRVEPARPQHLVQLPAIEIAAAAAFSDEDVAPELRQQGLPVDFFEAAAVEGRLWTAVEIASGRPVGFALATLVDGSAHLFEMDVLPEHGRRGVGRALVEAVLRWGREHGHPSVTLTTFRHVAWNAPFYRQLGFRELAASRLGPMLADQLRREAEHGLDPARRVAMRRDLSPGSA